MLLFGDVAKTTVAYALGVVNGATDGSSLDVDDRDAKDVVARVFVQPFKNGDNEGLKQLGFGIAGSSGTQRGTIVTPNPAHDPHVGPARSSSGTNGRDGGGHDVRGVHGRRHWRVVPQAYYYIGPLGLLTDPWPRRRPSAATSRPLESDRRRGS